MNIFTLDKFCLIKSTYVMKILVLSFSFVVFCVHVFLADDGRDSAGADSAGDATITGETSIENR